MNHPLTGKLGVKIGEETQMRPKSERNLTTPPIRAPSWIFKHESNCLIEFLM